VGQVLQDVPGAAGQQPIKTTRALEKMGMDLIGPLPRQAVPDNFTKWPEAIPLKDATARAVAGALLLVILAWGPPAKLISDQRPEFVEELNRELLRQWGIK